MRQEINEAKPAISPIHCLEKVCSQWSKEEEPSGLPELDRQSRESREPEAAGVPGEEYQRGENYRERESSGDEQWLLQNIQLHSDWLVYEETTQA